jgi:peptidoglycan/xylan/chitin deacetylase (PgdA/CDA1 family)
MKLHRIARRALLALPVPEALLRYRTRSLVTVLGYHRVLPPQGRAFPFSDGVISATPEEFARELKYLRENMDVISVPQLLEGIRNPSLLPRRPAVITFDDGYFDSYEYALPLLREANLPACFFVCTGIIGTRRVPWYEAWVCCLKRSRARRIESPFGGNDPPYELDEENLAASIQRFRQHIRLKPWNEQPPYRRRLEEATSVNPEDYVGKQLFMSWQQVKELAAAGMEIGGHTRSHPALSRVDDPDVLRDEVSGCFEDLLRMLDRQPVAFAYPFGYSEFMSEPADAEIARAGFEISFSFRHGFAPRRMSRTWRIPRIHASHGTDHGAFRLRTAIAPQLG